MVKMAGTIETYTITSKKGAYGSIKVDSTDINFPRVELIFQDENINMILEELELILTKQGFQLEKKPQRYILKLTERYV